MFSFIARHSRRSVQFVRSSSALRFAKITICGISFLAHLPVPALIAEGFGQSTDRQSADYYGRARGSAYESYTHLITAKDREYITEDENAKEGEKYIEITKMLTPWINYLQRSNWRPRTATAER